MRLSEHTPCVILLLSLGSPAETVHVQSAVDNRALAAPSPTRISRAVFSPHEHRVLGVGFN